MSKLYKIIKRTIGASLAVIMVTNSVTAIAAPSENVVSNESSYSEEMPVNSSDYFTDSSNSELSWGAKEDVIDVSAPTGASVPYIDKGIVRTRNDYKPFTEKMSDGWYVLSGEKVTNDAVVISGKVNLILEDDSYLEANNGIYITKDSELIIWAQSNDIYSHAGRIKACPENGPGIGSVRDAIGGNLTINGGLIEAKGGQYGAGIGGGRGEKSGFGNITINNGYVSATGGDYAAGIGFGHRNWTIGVVTINGGEVNATGGQYAAGIGGSEDRSGPTVTINGGEVTAKATKHGAGIGGGDEGDQGGKITINGGTVNATGNRGAGLGGGGQHHTGLGHWERPNNGGEIEINGGEVNATGDEYSGTAIGGGLYGKNGPITINGGTVTAIIKNTGTGGAAIGSQRGIGDAITINGGVVKASGLGYGPAIGGASSITINGGQITAIAQDGAGIGGFGTGKEANTKKGGNCGNITITGGNVTAISCGKGAGLGNGQRASGGSITITGGNVTASSNEYEGALWARINFSTPNNPAIGMAGTAAVRGLIWLFSMGDVGGAGIGGGYKGDGPNIKITGGNIVASAKHKGSSAIGRGEGGSSDGKLEIYDEAIVSAAYDVTKVTPVDKNKREAACRSNCSAVIKKCDHANATCKDVNSKVHKLECSYCKGTGKKVEEEHKFDPQTHKCVCGRTQYKVTAHVNNDTNYKDAYEKVDYTKSDGFIPSYDGGVGYITEGDTLNVKLGNKDYIQELELTYAGNGQNEVVQPIEYKTNSDGTVVAKYTMPAKDIDITYTIKNKPAELKTSEVTSMPTPKKGVVYDGTKHIIVEPGSCKGGTLFYALGKDDKTAPDFDGDKSDIFGQNDGSKTWKHGVPMVTDAGTYYVWYMVKGDEGYTDTKPMCVKGEIKTVESAKADEKTTKGEVRDTTDYFKKGNNSKKKVKTTVELSNNGYKGDVKLDIEVAGKKIDSPKEGDVLDVVEGDKIKVDIPASVDAKKGVQLFYKKKDNVTYIATPIVNKLNSDGSLHMEFEAPGYDSRLVIQLDASAAMKKQIAYTAPKPRSGLIYNGKNQALVKVGSAKGGKMYYAIGTNGTTAPEFDGLSNDDNKTWGVGVPQASQPGKYYVWYTIKGEEGYEDVAPKCVVAEIGKSFEQKKEAVDEEDEDDDDGVPVIDDTNPSENKESEDTGIVENTEDTDDKDNTKPSVVKVTGDNKLTDVVDISKEDKEQGVNIWMEEEDITDELDDYSKSILYERFKDYEIPMVIDLKVYMKSGDEVPSDITDLQKNVELGIEIPNKYLKEDRNFVILRLNEDDPTDVTVINPKEFDQVHNELIFETSKICPFAIAYKADEDVVNKKTVSIVQTPSVISPKAKEGLYYSGKEMELLTEGSVVGGTFYYALGNDSGTAPEFDGLSDDKNKKWTKVIPTAKEVGKYNVWYKVVGDEGYSDLEPSCIVSEIKEVPASQRDDIQKEQGKTRNVTDHPDVKDKNPHNVRIDNEVKPPVPVKPAVVDNKDDYDDDYDDDDDFDDDDDYDSIIDDEDGINYWIEADDITDTLTEDDIRIIYEQLRKYYIGYLIDLTLIMQNGDETIDITDVTEPITISFDVPDDINKNGRKYIIYMLEDDGDFENPTVIRPTSYDEATKRLTFETNTIKPFIIGYTDDPDEEDLIVFEEDDEISPLAAKTTIYKGTTNNDDVVKTPTPQTNLVPQVFDNASFIMEREALVSNMSTVKIPSAKTGDNDILGVILNIVINIGTSIGL